MPSLQRSPLLLVLVVAVVCAAIMFGGAYVLSRWLSVASRAPEALRKAEVKEGGRWLGKSLQYEARGLGTVTELRYGELDKEPGPELAVVGQNGADYVVDGRRKRTVRFKAFLLDRVGLLKLEGDHKLGFLNRKSYSRNLCVFDSTGAKVWQYEGGIGCCIAAAGDVDGDGKAEVAVGYGGDGGVILLDANGKKLWHQPDGNVWHIEIADLDGDGRAEIIHSNVGGLLRIRDAEGQVVLDIDPEVYVGDFAVTGWGEEPRPCCMLVAEDGSIHVFAKDGSLLGKRSAPELHDTGDAQGTVVRFSPSETYHATLVNYAFWNRSALYLHNREGKLVFWEVIGEECESLGTMPRGNGESLLVGCRGRVWSYQPAAAAAAP